MRKIITMDANENITYKDGLERFIKSRKVKNLTRRTIENYEYRGNKFGNFIGKEKLISSITEADIEDYILTLQEGKDVKDRTINSDLSAIRTILYYFAVKDWMDKFDIKLLKVEQEIKDIYTNKELVLLLKKPNLKETDFTEYKVWVLVNYFIGTGNRLGSVVELKIGDLDLEGGTVLIRNTKRRMQQVVPLTISLIAILEEYLEYRKGKKEDFLFCNTTGEQLDIRTIEQQVARYNKKRGVEKTSIHLFRHTFATLYIKNGGDIYRLSRLLGHSSISMTAHYIQALPVEVIVNYDSNNPLESIRKEMNGNNKIKMR